MELHEVFVFSSSAISPQLLSDFAVHIVPYPPYAYNYPTLPGEAVAVAKAGRQWLGVNGQWFLLARMDTYVNFVPISH